MPSNSSVPVPPIGAGTRNHARSSGSRIVPEPFFKPLGAFLDEARRLPEPSFLVPNLVPDLGRVFVVAEPNAGKTFFALVIAKSAAAGGRHVFLVLEEGGKRRTGQRFEQLQFEPDWPVSIAHLKGVKLADAPTLKALADAVRAAEAPVVVLDPLVSVFDGDENKTPDMSKFRDQLEVIMGANERTLLIVVHHASKGGGKGEGSAQYSARGSSVTTGWADCQLNLAWVKPPAPGHISFDVFVAKMRDGERGRRERFVIDLATSKVSTAELSKATDDDRTARAVDLAHEPVSKSDLAKALKGNRQTTLQFISDLVERGDLELRDGKVVAPLSAPSGEAP